jgi:hypothetical protein
LGRDPPCLARDPPWERSKLGFIKSASSRFSRFATIPCQRHISKSALEDNLFWFRTYGTTGISGAISISLIRIGPSTCPNQRYHRGPQLW